MMDNTRLPIVFKPSPFRAETVSMTVEPGKTISGILAEVPNLPPEIWTNGFVTIAGMDIPRDRWHRVRPKPGTRHIVHVGLRYGGGGGGGDKNIFATIATIALVVAAAAISGGALAGTYFAGATGLSFAAGSVSAAVAAATVSVAGSLIVGALFPPPSQDEKDSGGAVTGTSAAIEGNVLEPFDPIPFVVGSVRVSPVHLILPWTEVIDDDTYVHAILGVSAATSVADIEINDAPIEEFQDLEYQVYDGITNTTEIDLIENQVYESAVNTLLSAHKVEEDNSARLVDSTFPSRSYPKYHNFRSRAVGDEIWITLQFATLVYNSNSGTAPASIPFRIQIKETADSDWISLPEIHLTRESSGPFKCMIKLSWDDEDTSLTEVTNSGNFGGDSTWDFAFPEILVGDTWQAPSYFISGFTTQHVRSDGKNLYFYMNESGTPFPKAIYDIRIKRGCAYITSLFSANGSAFGYEYDSTIAYFFTHSLNSSPPEIPAPQRKIPSQCSIQAISTVFYEAPLTSQEGLTLIALRVKNTSIRTVTALFSGRAPNWDGVDWDTTEETSNPASWFRAIALGQHSIRAVFKEAQMDDEALQDWHDFCESKGMTVNMVVGGKQGVGDILQLIAGCGHAVPRIADKVGVVYEYDRSAETPTQLFTQRNTAGLTIRRAFPKLPDGLRVKFNDADNLDKPTEIFVYRPGFDSSNASDIEAITYDGVTTFQKAVDRAVLDLRQLTERSRLYDFSADIEILYSTKGSLVALSHDVVRRHYDSARVVSVETSGSNVTGLTLDVPLRMSLVDDYGESFPAGVVIQLKDGSTITHQIDETTDSDTITFTTPFAEPADAILETDCLVAMGPFSSAMKRMLVKEITPNADFSAAVTVIDEAPSLNLPLIAARINSGTNLIAALYLTGVESETDFTLPALGETINTGSGPAWQNPIFITQADDAAASVFSFSAATSDTLKASDFNVDIPLDATIVGFEVKIRVKTTLGIPANVATVNIGKADATLGTAKTPATAITPAYVEHTYGGPTDLWGLTWTPAEVNTATFQARMQVASAVELQAEVDVMFMKVHFIT